MFRVPESSDPPSTPGRLSMNHPSTTPAGPPPTGFTAASFTPAGHPPPSSLFGDSHIHQPTAAAAAAAVNDHDMDDEHAHGFYDDFVDAQAAFGPPPSRFGAAPIPSAPGPFAAAPFFPPPVGGVSTNTNTNNNHKRNLFGFGGLESPRSAKRSRFGDSLAGGGFTASMRSQAADGGPLLESKYDLLALAKGLTAAMPQPELTEVDTFILETESIMIELWGAVKSGEALTIEKALDTSAEQLRDLWTQMTGPKRKTRGIPTSKDDPLVKANAVAQLLVRLHYGAKVEVKEQLRSSRFGAPPKQPQTVERRNVPMPKVLLDWMTEFGEEPMDLEDVLAAQGRYSAENGFWEAVLISAFHGRFQDTLTLLKGADFSVAASAVIDNSQDEPGYRGAQLDAINEVVQDAILLLQDCPAVRSDDWDVKGADWTLFRRRVTQAMEDLRDFAEGDNRFNQGFNDGFGASAFGVSAISNQFSFSTASRRAESRVPWTVYENLCFLYKQLLGNPDEIVANAVDWVEATIGHAVWWNGEEAGVPTTSLRASRMSLTRPTRTRESDVAPYEAYRQRLRQAFIEVSHAEEEQLAIETTNPVHVALACVFEGNLEGLLLLLRRWSLTITTSVVELAHAGNWLGTSPSKALGGFDKSDLMVLSYGQGDNRGVDKDEYLMEYAEFLHAEGVLTSERDGLQQPGWSLAIQLLCRLDDTAAATERINRYLDDIPLDSEKHVDDALALCSDLDLAEQANKIAERYADSRVADTENTNYGAALLYYARAHNETKLRNVLGVMSSLCLVHSMAYPPTAELDDRLHAYLDSPKDELSALAAIDHEAATLLSTHLAGYATLRQFYDYRDEAVLCGPGEKPSMGTKARYRAAATALIALISSAAASIRGGLYDPDDDTVVQIDGLLTLLGEALPFLVKAPAALDRAHLTTLLAVLEDFETLSTSKIRSQCEHLLAAALAAAASTSSSTDHATASALHTRLAPLPSASVSASTLLRKSTSNLTASSYDLVGSEVLGGSLEGSAVLVRGPVRREWDWRQGLLASDVLLREPPAAARRLVRTLRVLLAEEVRGRWVRGG